MASPLQSVIAPHAAHTEQKFLASGEGGRTGTFTPDSLPPGASRIVNAIRGLFRARTMQEYCDVLPVLARDVVWDAPPILTSRKGHLRVASYLAKLAGSLDFEPALIHIKSLASGRNLVDITGTVRFYPRRTWLLLPTLLLPHSIPIRTTIRVGVNGSLSDGKIELIYGTWHNLPSLPSPLRNVNGLFLGGLPHLTEPIWSRAVEFVGDDFYKRKRERHIADGTAGAVDTAIDFGSNAVNNIGDVVSNVISTVMDTASKAVDTGRYYADTTVQAAQERARMAADTAAGVARSAYETVMPSEETTTQARETVGAAAEKVRQQARAAGAALDPSGAHYSSTQAAR